MTFICASEDKAGKEQKHSHRGLWRVPRAWEERANRIKLPYGRTRLALPRTMETVCATLFGPHVHGFWSLFPLRRLELDALIVFERAESLSGDIRVMDEQVVPAVIGSDESKSFFVTEPLH